MVNCRSGPKWASTGCAHEAWVGVKHGTQTRVLHACLRWRNANARHRDVLAAERMERARIRSERGIRSGGRHLATAA
jgi:hypothetical protein